MFIKSKFLPLTAFALTLAFSATNAKTPKTHEVQNNVLEESNEEDGKIDLQKVSQAFGHLIGKNLDSIGFEFDMTEVIKGMKDSIAGKESPMNETECVQAISLVQEEVFQKTATKNLDEANSFMTKNAKEEGIIVLEKDKLQYKIEKQGEGTVVEKYFSPMIRYSGKFLDGKVFGTSQEDELISLDETISGFSQGIVGMKEGEKRTLYIHPELGYGTSGYLPPNSLLVFEIEVVKANATPKQEDSFTSISKEGTREIAVPKEKPDVVIR